MSLLEGEHGAELIFEFPIPLLLVRFENLHHVGGGLSLLMALKRYVGVNNVVDHVCRFLGIRRIERDGNDVVLLTDLNPEILAALHPRNDVVDVFERAKISIM